MQSLKIQFIKVAIIIIGLFLFPLFIISNVHSSEPSQNVILIETWEDNSTLSWRCDYIAGDSYIDTNPVYNGMRAFKQVSLNPGNYVHCFGDHPLLSHSGNIESDIFIEEYIYFPYGFQWPNGDMKLWIVNSFERWGAGYTSAEGRNKPHSWAPYYMTISVDGHGRPFGQLTRADGLGGLGELWGNYWQNQGNPVALQIGQWNKLSYRLKLNTPGQNNGIFQLWINDVLKCDYTNMNFRGTYTQYGWNHLMKSVHANPSHPQSQWVSRDDIRILSGKVEPIPELPRAPTGLTIIISRP